MSSQELLAEIQKLPPEERRRLLEALTSDVPRQPEPRQAISEYHVERRLLAEDIVTGIPPRLPDEDEESRDMTYDPSARPIWEIVEELGKSIPDTEWDKLPRDASVNLDRYLYGEQETQR